MKIEKVFPRGWKLNASNDTIFIGEYGTDTGNSNPGVIYKDDNAFLTGEGVCYVPEWGFENSAENESVLFEFHAKACVADKLEDNTYTTSLDRGDGCYTRQDFLDICYGNPEFAKELYGSVDWQSPETLWEEWMEDDEFFETVKKWCKENNIPWEWDETMFFPGDEGDLDAEDYVKENKISDYDLEWDDIEKGYVLTILEREV